MYQPGAYQRAARTQHAPVKAWQVPRLVAGRSSAPCRAHSSADHLTPTGSVQQHPPASSSSSSSSRPTTTSCSGTVPLPPQPQPLTSSSTPCTPSRRALLSAPLLAAYTAVAAGSLTPAAAQAAAAAAVKPPAAAVADCALGSNSSGLRWCDLVVGRGPPALKGAFIKTHHTARLASNGAVFDSSYAKKQPLIWKAGEHEVMEAWDRAVLGEEGMSPMAEGGVRRVVVPPGVLQRQGTKSLTWVVGLLDALEEAGEAVGSNGSPTSDLIFDIELLPKKRK